MPAKFFDPSHTLLFVALFFYVEGLKFMQPYQNLGTLKFHILESVSFSSEFYCVTIRPHVIGSREANDGVVPLTCLEHL